MAKYRIVTDKYCGYEVQVWRWWWPFWVQPYCNTHLSIEAAERYAKDLNFKREVVKELGEL